MGRLFDSMISDEIYLTFYKKNYKLISIRDIEILNNLIISNRTHFKLILLRIYK